MPLFRPSTPQFDAVRSEEPTSDVRAQLEHISRPTSELFDPLSHPLHPLLIPAYLPH